MIRIQKSASADTRTCDVSQVSKEQLKAASYSHISDVRQALAYFQKKIQEAGERHDFTKLDGIDQFHSDFKTKFEVHEWWDNHRKVERHHLGQADGVREDVDLIDVLEFIADCITAGMARTGTAFDPELDSKILLKAFNNTSRKLQAEIEVEK